MDARFWTPLHYAAMQDNQSVIDLLFLNGAHNTPAVFLDIKDKINSVKDALNFVQPSDFIDEIWNDMTEDEADLILGQNPYSKEPSLKSVLLRMDWIDSIKPTSDVFEIEAPKLVPLLNFKDKLGRTALHIAVLFGKTKIVENLMFLKADSSVKDEFGFRPIDYLEFNQDINEDELTYIWSLLVKSIDKKTEQKD